MTDKPSQDRWTARIIHKGFLGKVDAKQSQSVCVLRNQMNKSQIVLETSKLLTQESFVVRIL